MTTATKSPTAPTWDLDSIFPGGSSSEKFKQFRDNVRKSLSETAETLKNLPETIDNDNVSRWVEFVLKLQSDVENIELVLAFAGCLTAQDVDDAQGHIIEGEGSVLFSEWKKLNTQLEALSLKQSDEQWKILTSHDKMKDIAFTLEETRRLASAKMPLQLESLALDLSVSGYHAWNRIYDKMAGDLKVDFEEDGKTQTLSLGQLATKFSSPDRSLRRQAFEKMTGAWEEREELATMMLNALVGFRLSLNKNRKWDSPLYEPLTMSRMKQESLDSMWRVVGRETHRLQPYVDAKKKILGIDKFCWYDEFAPCGKVDRQYSFEEAGRFIEDNLRPLSADLADFVRMALDKKWVEAEDRSGKAGGAFCTGLGPLRQTRVFMTYALSYDNLLTLAHELGHAYHNWVLRDRPYFATDYPMNLAETASIFAETAVTDAALAQTDDPMEKLMLLEQKIQSAYVLFTDLHCRYIFDRELHERRREGEIPAAQLREMMIDAQKQAFGSLLDESGYHPLFWCSKLHFYITGAPFYNFPYTFGFLFAGGVYDRSRKEGAAFAENYRALLADTGSMTTEDVAKKHLGVDLTTEQFWQDAVDRSLSDIDEFVKLADSI